MDCVLIGVVMGVMLLGLRWFVYLQGPRKRLPPGPRPLPIIGNIHQLGKNQTETLRQLAKTYGPLMSICIGSVYTVVASTPEMAMELLQRHGQVFSGRTVPHAMDVGGFSKFSIFFGPAGKEWRDKRKVCKEILFSERCLEESEGLRQEMLQKLVDHVEGHCDRRDVVNIHDVVFMANLNLLLTTIFSITSPDTTMELMKIMKDFFSLFAPNITDYFPILKVLDPQGMKRKAKLSLGKLLAKFRDFLNHRLDHRRINPNNKKQDLLEAIIDITQANDYNITTQDIPYLLLELIVGGIDSNSNMVEWIMTELLFNPDKLERLKREIKSAVGENGKIQEADIASLPYLQAVIKETFRYHPPGPLAVTQMSEADQEVNGYMIPKGTQIVVNTWSMAKDPSIWTDPASFEPERFLDNKLDFKGQHFQLIPFGAGRRICPGIPLATHILQMTTAVLVHNFDWKLEKDKDHPDHKEAMFRINLSKTTPLRAFPF
ncbi:ferruginol synthase-like [Salvia splendens]|uniref:ferruginol synthase-like n=1 Tax=Salvia splendens TaxID=180675 RepID=UPI001C273E19|nr:ferruginol synthase-like [Salvia splendens]